MVHLKDFFLKLWFHSLEVVILSGIRGLALFPYSWSLDLPLLPYLHHLLGLARCRSWAVHCILWNWPFLNFRNPSHGRYRLCIDPSSNLIFSLRNISKMLQHIALKARVPSFTTEKLHRFKFYQNWCRTTSICARQPQSVQGNLNLCRATSICAKQPQSVQNNLNSCKTTSIRAEKKKPKSNGLFQRDKMNFRTQAFFSG